MNHETALWAIFILLCVLFVIVVVTARRGPWQPPRGDRQSPAGHWVVGLDPARDPDDLNASAIIVRWERMGIPRSHIRIIGKDDQP